MSGPSMKSMATTSSCKSDSADDIHHFMPLDSVEKIDDNRIYLKEGARIPEGLGNKSTMANA